MELQEFLNLIAKRKLTITIVVVVFVFFGVSFTFVQPLRFSALSKVLVVQGLPDGVDPYQVSRSNEHVASLLTEVISTNSFFNEVLESGFNIDKSFFKETTDKQMKQWKKTVKVSSNDNGIVTIKALHSNRVQVKQVSEAIIFILSSKHENYHGFGSLVSVKVIERPVISDRPVKPNIFINIGVAFSFGMLLSLSYIYLFPERRYSVGSRRTRYPEVVSRELEEGRDEFEIRPRQVEPAFQHVEQVAKHTEEKELQDEIVATEQVIDEIKIENDKVDDGEKNMYNQLRDAMRNAPADLPVVNNNHDKNEEIQTDINHGLMAKEEGSDQEDFFKEYKPRDIENQGNMQNIINRPNQRG